MNGYSQNNNFKNDIPPDTLSWLSEIKQKSDLIQQGIAPEEYSWMEKVKQESDKIQERDWISLEEVNKRIEEAEERYTKIKEETKLSQRNYLDLLSEKEKRILQTKDPKIYEKLSGGEGAKKAKELENLEYNLQLLKKTKKLIEAPERGSNVNQVEAWLQSIHSPLLVDYATMGINELKRGFDIVAIESRGNKNPESLSEEEKNLLTTYNIFQTIRGEKELKSGYNIGRISLEMIPYMATFAATGGIATGVKGTITGGMKAAEKGIVPLLKKIAGYTAGAGTQALAMPIGYIDFAERRISQYDIKDEGENLTVTLKGDAEPVGISALKSYATAFSEVFSEGLGAPMQMGVKKLAGGMTKNITKGGIYGFLNSVKKATRWNGAMYEWAEELINDVMQSVLTGDQPISSIFDGKRQFEIFASCLMMGTAFKSAELPAQAQVYSARRDYEKSEKKFREVVPSNISLMVLDAMDGKSIKDMGTVLAEVAKNEDKLTAEQKGAVLDYVVKRFGYDAIKGGLESDLDEKARIFREKESGDIITAEDDLGNRYFINERLEDGTVVVTDAETFKKSMLSQDKLKNSASVGYTEWRDAQTETTLDELFQAGNAEIDQLAAEENLKNVPYGIGENILYNGEEYTVTDISTDGTLYTIPTGEEAEPVEITPDMYKYTEKSVQEGETSPLRIKVGKSFFQMRDEGNGLFSITQQFTDKKAANKLATQLDDKFEGRGYEINSEAAPVDPNDPFSDSVYTIKINTTSEEKMPEGEEITAKAEKTKKGTAEKTEIRGKPKKVTVKAEKKEEKLKRSSNEIYGDYLAEKENVPINRLSPAEEELISRRVNRKSFERFGDPSRISQTIIKRWFTRNGKNNVNDLDSIAQEISEMTSMEFTPQDIVDFIMKYPSGYVRKTTDRMQELRREYKDVTGKSIDQHEKTKEVTKEENLEQEIINFVGKYDKNWFTIDDIKNVIQKNKKDLSDEKYKQYLEWISEEHRRIEEANLKVEPGRPGLPYKKTEPRERDRENKGREKVERTERSGEKEKLTKGLREKSDRVWVEQEAKKITKDWNIPGITVVQKQSDLPKDIQGEGKIVGVFTDEKRGIYLVAENIIKDSRQASRALITDTLFHETVGHYGVRRVLGKYADKYQQIIINLARDRFDDIKNSGLVDAYIVEKEEYKEKTIDKAGDLSEEDLFELGEEMLAHLAEENPNSSPVKRIVSWIREQLRKIFPDLKITNSEIRSILVASRKYVIKKKPTKKPVRSTENIETRWVKAQEENEMLLDEIEAKEKELKTLERRKTPQGAGKWIEFSNKKLKVEKELEELHKKHDKLGFSIYSLIPLELSIIEFEGKKYTPGELQEKFIKKYYEEGKFQKPTNIKEKPAYKKKESLKPKEKEVKRQKDYEFAGSMFTPEQMTGSGQLDLLALIDKTERERSEKKPEKPAKKQVRETSIETKKTRYKKYIYPKQPSQLSEAEKTQIFEKAKKRFGTTTDIKQAGWILPDGSMLDFKRNESFDGGFTEHSAISKVLDDQFKTNIGGGLVFDSISYFTELGAVRVKNWFAISFYKKPTEQQLDKIKRLAINRMQSAKYRMEMAWTPEGIEETSSMGIDLEVDYGTGVKGFGKPYIKYPAQTNYHRVLRDIKDYFDKGIEPVQPSFARFKRDPKAQKIKELIAESKKSTTTEERKREIEQEIMNLYFEPGELVSYEEKARKKPRFKVAEKINTKAFKDWFGKSKIVDEKGKPRVAYHGTRGDFDEFQKTEVIPIIDRLLGFHFAENPQIADAFVYKEFYGEDWVTGSIIPAHIKMENPLNLKGYKGFDQNIIAKVVAFDVFKQNKELFDKWFKYMEIIGAKPHGVMRDYIYKNNLKEFVEEYFLNVFDEKSNKEIANDFLQNTEYDGIIYTNTDLSETEGVPEGKRTCYIVFDPKNIKSATANVGTYSPETADIRYKKHIKTAYGSLDQYKKNINKVINDAKKIKLSPNKRYKLIDISEVSPEEQAGEYISKYTGGKTFLDVFKENAIKEEFTTENIAYDEPIGMVVKSAQDVAQAYSVFRSPYAEKAHIIFARDGKIIANFSETISHPGASTFTKSFNFNKTLFHYATKYGVNEVYMVHNHPSGNIKPSEADLRMTGAIAEDIDSVNAMLGSGRDLWMQKEPDIWGSKIKLKGHILLDSDKFTFITVREDMVYRELYRNAEYGSYEYKEPKNIPDFYKTRITITGRDDIVKVGKQLLADAKYNGAIIFLAANAAINGFMPIPKRISYDELDKMIGDGMLSRGVGRYIIIHDGSMAQFDSAYWSEECQDVINMKDLKSERVNIMPGKRFLPSTRGKESKTYILDKASIRYKKADIRLKKLLSGNLNMSKLQRAQEIFQDRMLSVKLWQDEILRRGGKASNMTDPYGQENLSYSIIMNAMKRFDKSLLNPLENTVSKIVMNHNKNLDEIQKYMKAKHAPERNENLKEKTGKDNNSGFTTEEAQAIVSAFEGEVAPELIKELWINKEKVTDFILDRWVNDGFIDRALYNKIKNMYKYYVPLRGWMKLDDSQQLHGYQHDKLKNTVQLNKKAKGRVTESDNPLQYMANMAYSAIIVGEKNRVKQHAARLAMANADMTDIHRLRKLYLVFTGGFDEGGKEIWEERYERPDQRLWDQGMVQMKIQDTGNQARKTRSEAKQHESEVWFNGEKQVLVFPDTNPIAPAIANALDKNNTLWGELTGVSQNTVGKLTRQLVFNFTAKNPAFFPINQIRDVGYAALSHFVYGDTKKAAKFMKNLPKARAAIIRHLRGKADPKKNKIDAHHVDFMIGGGRTGYIYMRDIDQLTSDIQKDIRRLTKKKNLADKAWETVWIKGGKMMENFATRSEDLSRFATYLTEIEMGKTLREANKAAKDITVNFNRKGRISGLLGAWYAFFNANLQGGENIIRMARKNGTKYSMVAVGFMSLGFLNAFFASLWSGDDDEDGKEDYSQLNDYLKYNYLCIPVTKEKFITIPLPFGWRFFHSLGVLAYQNIVSDEKQLDESIRQGLVNMFESISPVNPVDFITPNNTISWRPIVPTAFVPAYDLSINEDFAGRRLYKQPFTQVQKGRLADSAMGLSYVNKIIKWVTDTAFKLGGGDPELKTKFRFNKEGNVMFNKEGEVVKVSEFYDWNPSKIEYIIEYYLGGRGKFWNNILKTGTGIITGAYEFATGKREFKEIIDNVHMYNVPVIRRLVREAWQQSIYDEYYRISEIMEDYRQGKRNREMVYGEVSEEMGEKYYELWESYEKDINDINDDIKEVDDPDIIEDLKQEKENLMEKLIEEYNTKRGEEEEEKKSNVKEKENETK